MLSIAQNLFTDTLTGELAEELPGPDPNTVLKNGDLRIMKMVPAKYVEGVKSVYNDAIVDVHYLAWY